jgi:hypothetical protein
MDKEGSFYIKCICSISFDDSSKHNLNYRIMTNPSLGSDETIDDYKDRVDDDTCVHENNDNYAETFDYMNSENIKINIKSFSFENENRSVITLKVNYE